MSIWSNLNSLFCSIFIFMYHFYSAELMHGGKGEFASQYTSQRSLPELLWRIWKMFHSNTEFIYRHKAFIKHEQLRGQHHSLTVMYASLVGTLQEKQAASEKLIQQRCWLLIICCRIDSVSWANVTSRAICSFLNARSVTGTFAFAAADASI